MLKSRTETVGKEQMCSKVELYIQTSGDNAWVRTSGRLEKCYLTQNIAHPVYFNLNPCLLRQSFNECHGDAPLYFGYGDAPHVFQVLNTNASVRGLLFKGIWCLIWLKCYGAMFKCMVC